MGRAYRDPVARIDVVRDRHASDARVLHAEQHRCTMACLAHPLQRNHVALRALALRVRKGAEISCTRPRHAFDFDKMLLATGAIEAKIEPPALSRDRHLAMDDSAGHARDSTRA